MTRHPLLLAVLTADVMTLVLLLVAATTALRVALRWDPGDPGERQLRLEARAEAASLAVWWAFGLHLFATSVLVYAITNILPDVVPGAMCGTGVLQAMHSGGPRMLIYRLLAAGVFWIWGRLERMNHALPEAPLVPINARLLLLLLPVCGLALHASWQALTAMDLQQPVDCCAVVYDQFQSLGEARRTLGVGHGVWAGVFGVVTLAMILVAGAVWRGRPRRWRSLLLALVGCVWLPLATVALVRTFAAYHYGVLHHYCPWCLFLPEYDLVGFPVYAAWMLVALEAPAVLVLSARGLRERPTVCPLAAKGTRGAARNILLAGLVFVLLAAGPAVWWRLNFGMWLTG